MRNTLIALTAAGLMTACASPTEIAEVPASSSPTFNKPPVVLNDQTSMGGTPVTAFPSAPPVAVPGATPPAMPAVVAPTATDRGGPTVAITPLACAAKPAAVKAPPRAKATQRVRPAKTATIPCAAKQ